MFFPEDEQQTNLSILFNQQGIYFSFTVQRFISLYAIHIIYNSV